MGAPDYNLSTEHQPPGDAKRPGDTLDRDRKPDDAEAGARPKDGAPDPGFATNGE
ncbi:hypothetical protein [Sphingomonas profundi]|uniref:hypothetical protein n=1 Tax=Alterirhizorhabdus profundi TaxID=2681549 RepID=UPI0012E8E473|nr:hypothetical protein [Sphingomonas profundi]